MEVADETSMDQFNLEMSLKKLTKMTNSANTDIFLKTLDFHSSYELAIICLILSVSQTSVERAFSTVKIIFAQKLTHIYSNNHS